MTSAADFSVIVIGCGVSGVGAAYYLGKNNIKYTVFEKEPAIGGTWFVHKFNGVRFDSMHFQTIFSFAPLDCKPQCDGPMFLEYLNDICNQNNITPNIHFNESVLDINFDTKTNLWHVNTSQNKSYTANFVINCNGYYNHDKPNFPPEFLNSKFKGEIIHSMKIDQDRDSDRLYTGKDVVIVGSGATAVTMAPNLAKRPDIKSLTMIQRSPNYFVQADFGQVPFYSFVVRLFVKYGIKWVWYLYRLIFLFIGHEFMMTMVHRVPESWSRKLHEWQVRFFAGQTKDSVQKNFTAKYRFGDQRPTISLGMLESIRKGLIKVKTGRIITLDETGLLMDDESHVDADTIVVCTGFNLDYFKFKLRIDGVEQNMYEDHVLRRDQWFEGVPNFNNAIMFARLSAKYVSCYTPLLEHSMVLLVEIIRDMQRQNCQRMTIKPLGYTPEKYLPMSSGYIMRAADKAFHADPEELNAQGTMWHIAFGYRYRREDYVFE